MPVKDFDQTLKQALCWLFMCDIPDLESNEILNSVIFEGIETAFDFGFRCPLGYEGMYKHLDYQTIIDRDTIARLSALHHYWNQLMESNPEKYLVDREELPLPDPNKTNPVTFLRLWLPDPMKAKCYGRAENKLPKPLMVKYDGEIKNAKSFIDRVKATLASCSAPMHQCLTDRDYANAYPELNKNLYAWTLSYIDEKTRKLYWDKHKETGDGHQAFSDFMEDPGFEHYQEIQKQEAETQLLKLTLTKSKGKLLDYANQFRTLVAEAGEPYDEVKQIELFLGGLDDKDYKEEADLLYKKAKRSTLLKTINAVLSYEADVISRRKKIEGLKGNNKPPVKETSGQGRGNKHGRDGNKNQGGKGDKEKANTKPTIPRIVKEDWKNLSGKQQAQFLKNGKLQGYKVYPDTDNEGKHRCVKNDNNNQGDGKKPKNQFRAKLTKKLDASNNEVGAKVAEFSGLETDDSHDDNSSIEGKAKAKGTKRKRDVEQDEDITEGPLGQILKDMDHASLKPGCAILGDNTDDEE